MLISLLHSYLLSEGNTSDHPRKHSQVVGSEHTPNKSFLPFPLSETSDPFFSSIPWKFYHLYFIWCRTLSDLCFKKPSQVIRNPGSSVGTPLLINSTLSSFVFCPAGLTEQHTLLHVFPQFQRVPVSQILQFLWHVGYFFPQSRACTFLLRLCWNLTLVFSQELMKDVGGIS